MSEIWNLSALCRCCHSDGALKSLQAPHVHDGKIEIYAVLLRDTFGLHINPPTIEASYSICENCIVVLRIAYYFKKRVEECEKKFQEYCENEGTVYISDNVKIEVEDDNVIINPGLNDIYDDFNDIDDSDGGYSEDGNRSEGSEKKTDKEDDKSETTLCVMCNESFSDVHSKQLHMFEVHVADGLSCKICKKTFVSKVGLLQHSSKRHFKMWRCEFCVEVFVSEEERDIHEHNEHVKHTGYVCDHCHKSFQKKQSLNKHLKWHKGTEEFVCETCGHAFKKKFGLKVHIETVHENQRKFQCCQCGKAFKSNKSLMLHNYSHTGELPFQCPTCSKGCKTRTDLRYHMERHERPTKGKDDTSNVGWNLGGDDCDDDDDGAGDSDGGYADNDLGKESETEITKQNMIEVEIEQVEETKPSVGPPEEDIKTEGSVFETEEGGYDSPDDGEWRLSNNDIPVESEDKPKSKRVKKFSYKNYYESKFTCDFCQEQFASKKELQRHYSNKHVPEDFSCTLCNSSFRERASFMKHLMSKHLNKTLCCQYCIETFESLRTLQRHQRIHTDNGYFCDCCQKKFKWKLTLRRHLHYKMGNYEEFPCETCGRAFKLLSNLKLHIRHVHEKVKPFKCNICDKSFSLRKHLVWHTRSHTGERPFKCDICSKGFVSKHVLKAHRQRHETVQEEENIRVQCDICGKNYTKYTIKQHIHSHTKPFKCEFCDQKFGQNSALKRHKKLTHGTDEDTHADAKSFECEICGRVFSRKAILIGHKQRKHAQVGDEGIKAQVQCNVCGKYYTKDSIKQHMNCHTRPFKCDVCGRGFSQKPLLMNHRKSKHNISEEGTLSKQKNVNALTCKICNKAYYNWDVHKRIHDKKPFKCDLCDKFYATKEKLDKHLQVKHYKERKYSCDVCDKMFTRPECVRIHKQRRHDIEWQKNERVPVVIVEKIDINFDSALPAYAIPKMGSEDNNSVFGI